MDIIPNLSLIFATPNEIFDPFNKLVKGRWYKPESGLLVLSKVIVMVEIRDIIIEYKIIFLINLLFKKNK